jgi:hypothetical protein
MHTQGKHIGLIDRLTNRLTVRRAGGLIDDLLDGLLDGLWMGSGWALDGHWMGSQLLNILRSCISHRDLFVVFSCLYTELLVFLCLP